jgi:hypothetical protein
VCTVPPPDDHVVPDPRRLLAASLAAGECDRTTGGSRDTVRVVKWSVRTWVAVGVTMAGIALVVACGSGDVDATAAGSAMGAGPVVECRTDSSPTGTDEPEAEAPSGDSADELAPIPDFPPPTVPGNVSPPTTEAGSEPIEGDPIDPFDPDGEAVPALGGFRVDPPELGCVDFAVHLDQYGRFRIRSWGDDGIFTQVQVYSPSGDRIASWDTGEQQTYEGYTWEDEGGLPEAGTYVIRTIHRGGSHNSFVLIFYGDPP